MLQRDKQRPIFGNKAHSMSNRFEKVAFESLGKDLSSDVEKAIAKTAAKIDAPLAKQASLGNGFQTFSTVRKMIANKLGVSEFVAEDMTSKVITKSEQIANEYGGNQHEIIDGILNEMTKQTIEAPSVLNGAFDLHPVNHQSREIEETIKLRLMNELHMSNREADMYKTIVYKNAQDLAVTLRPKKREEIAKALVDLMVDTNDMTIIYNIKSSPTLMEALKAFL